MAAVALGEAEAAGDAGRVAGGVIEAGAGVAAGFSGTAACFADFLCLTALAVMAISPAPSPAWGRLHTQCWMDVKDLPQHDNIISDCLS